MKAFHDQSNVRSLDSTKARSRFDGMKTGDTTDTMTVARKGGKLSESDEDRVVDEFAQLEALENEAPDKGEE